MSYFDIKELSRRTTYKINTLYKKLEFLEEGKHYFKPNNGKLLFDESAVDFLVKGKNNGKSISEKRQSISLDRFLLQ